MTDKSNYDQQNQKISGSQINVGALYGNIVLDSKPLIRKRKEKTDDEMILIDKLRDWKEIHHMIHPLLDVFRRIDVELIKCQISPNKLDESLKNAEVNWRDCITQFRTMVEIVGKLENINDEPIIINFLGQPTALNEISQQIGEAENNEDAINIQNRIVDLKSEMNVMLNVTDFQIKKLVENLEKKIYLRK